MANTMTSKRDEEKEDSKKSKFAGLKKLSHEQLVELHDASGKELARRAKEKSKSKKPGTMSEKEFSDWSKREIAKHETGSGEDDDE
jgi:hypothetical protein